MLAKAAGAKKLFLFHMKPTYGEKERKRLLAEGKKAFKNTYLSKDLLQAKI